MEEKTRSLAELLEVIIGSSCDCSTHTGLTGVDVANHRSLKEQNACFCKTSLHNRHRTGRDMPCDTHAIGIKQDLWVALNDCVTFAIHIVELYKGTTTKLEDSIREM